MGISSRMCVTCTKIRFSSGSTRDEMGSSSWSRFEHETYLTCSCNQARHSPLTTVCTYDDANREDHEEDSIMIHSSRWMNGWMDHIMSRHAVTAAAECGVDYRQHKQ